jgi:hypothetical protein
MSEHEMTKAEIIAHDAAVNPFTQGRKQLPLRLVQVGDMVFVTCTKCDYHEQLGISPGPEIDDAISHVWTNHD